MKTNEKEKPRSPRISTTHLPPTLQDAVKTRHDHYLLTRTAVKSDPPINDFVGWLPLLRWACWIGVVVVGYFGGVNNIIEVVYLIALALLIGQWEHTQSVYVHNWLIFRAIVKAELGFLVEEIENLEQTKDDSIQR